MQDSRLCEPLSIWIHPWSKKLWYESMQNLIIITQKQAWLFSTVQMTVFLLVFSWLVEVVQFSAAVRNKALFCQSTVPPASASYTATWYRPPSRFSMQPVAFKLSSSLSILRPVVHVGCHRVMVLLQANIAALSTCPSCKGIYMWCRWSQGGCLQRFQPPAHHT